MLIYFFPVSLLEEHTNDDHITRGEGNQERSTTNKVAYLHRFFPGTINTTQVPNSPSVDNNFITPPRIEDAAV
jgi:hypothetical protein